MDISEERKRKVILGYRQLMEEAMEVQEQTVRNRDTVIKITKVLDKAEKLVCSVNTSDEAVLDAKVISISSLVLKQNAETFDTNLRSYDASVYREHIKRFLQEGRQQADPQSKEYWKPLAPMANRCFKYKTPSLSCLLGSFQVGEVREQSKKIRTKKNTAEETKKKEPENVVKAEKQEDGVSETVNHIFKILVSEWNKNNQKPICYFKLVINPESFGATVENIFHVSFLVKDGLVCISADEDDFPVIAPIPKATVEERKKSNTVPEKSQMIVSINMRTWRELIDAFDITEPMIKPRSGGEGSQK